DGKLVGRTAVEVGGDERERGAGVVDVDGACNIRLADDRRGSFAHGGVDELRAVGLEAGDGDEECARNDQARVGGDAGDFRITFSAPSGHAVHHVFQFHFIPSARVSTTW